MRRTRLDLIDGILNVSANGAKKTEIMRKVGANFPQLKSYLFFLENEKYLERESNNGTFKTTQRGKEFIKDYKVFKGKYSF